MPRMSSIEYQKLVIEVRLGRSGTQNKWLNDCVTVLQGLRSNGEALGSHAYRLGNHVAGINHL